MKNLLSAIAALGLVGCGVDLCARSEDCARKAGDAFSITECRNEAVTSREKAQTAGCATEYNDMEVCLAGLTCDQLSTNNGREANCGAKLDQFRECYK